jgi:soluble lytic murein transglycosylase-like protein
MVIFILGLRGEMGASMAKRSIKRHIALCAFGMAVTAKAGSADIYRSEGADGTPHYADVALDSSYVLFLKNEATPTLPASSLSVLTTQSRATRTRFDPLIEQYANRYAVDPVLVRAVIDVESAFRPLAASSAGARGLMQLMPATAKQYGVVDRTDPAQNIEAGIHYLRDLLALHDGNVVLALASYNAGQNAVIKYGRRIPPYQATMLYVATVLAKRQAAADALLRH